MPQETQIDESNRETLPLQALPVSWIQKIFTEFKLIYGAGILSNMLGTDEREMMNIMQGWAEKLAFFKDHPHAIKYALENLPKDYPPNLLQFRDICREGIKHEPKPLALVEKFTPEQLAQNKIRVKELLRRLAKEKAMR